jgi:hypothetical protein
MRPAGPLDEQFRRQMEMPGALRDTHGIWCGDGGRGHSPVSSRCRKSESRSRIERASSSVGGESAVEGAGLQSIPVVVV